MKTKKSLSNVDLVVAVALHLLGWSHTDIAKVFGVTKQAIMLRLSQDKKAELAKGIIVQTICDRTGEFLAEKKTAK